MSRRMKKGLVARTMKIKTSNHETRNLAISSARAGDTDECCSFEVVGHRGAAGLETRSSLTTEAAEGEAVPLVLE